MSLVRLPHLEVFIQCGRNCMSSVRSFFCGVLPLISVLNANLFLLQDEPERTSADAKWMQDTLYRRFSSSCTRWMRNRTLFYVEAVFSFFCNNFMEIVMPFLPPTILLNPNQKILHHILFVRLYSHHVEVPIKCLGGKLYARFEPFLEEYGPVFVPICCPFSFLKIVITN